jgi:hypothetical protein
VGNASWTFSKAWRSCWPTTWCSTARLQTLLGGFTSRSEEVNGQPGALFDREGRLISVVILDVADGQIQGVSSIVNPDKLQHLGSVGDLRALLRERS